MFSSSYKHLGMRKIRSKKFFKLTSIKTPEPPQADCGATRGFAIYRSTAGMAVPELRTRAKSEWRLY